MIAQLIWTFRQNMAWSVLACVLVIAMVIWSYPPQTRRANRFWRLALPTLRCAALVTVALSLLRPVLLRVDQQAGRPVVLVLLDDSMSMSAVDAARSPAERVAIAQTLGALPEAARADVSTARLSRLEELRRQLRDIELAQNTLNYATVSNRGVRAAQDQLEAAQSLFRQSAEELAGEGLPRLGELAKPSDKPSDRWLAEARQRLNESEETLQRAQNASDDKLYNASDTERKSRIDAAALRPRLDLATDAIFSTGGILDSLNASAEVRILGLHSRSAMLTPGDMIASAARTDLPGGIAEAIRSAKVPRVAAVLVLTDGRQTGGSEALSGLSALGTPVFPVQVAPRTTRDSAVRQVALPGSAFVGETIGVQALVAGRPRSATVTCFDGIQTQTRTVNLTENGTPVDFTIKLEQGGARTIVIELPPEEGEATTLNNRVERSVKVLEDRLKLTLLSGAASWDYQYVRNALARTPWIDLTDVLVLDESTTPDLSAQHLLEQQVIVMMDFPAGALDAEQLAAIDRMIRDRGGSVVLVAGDAHLPRSFAASAIAGSWLPFVAPAQAVWRNWPGDEANFRFSPTAEALAGGGLKLDLPNSPEADRWLQLPRLFRYMPVPDPRPQTRVLLVERDSGAPVLTESRIGLGRSFFLGLNETWRWRYRSGERDHDRFWLQLVRLAGEEPYAVRQGGYSLDADRVRVAVGVPVRVRARVDRPEGSGEPSAVELTLERPGAPSSTHRLSHRTDAPPGRHETTLELEAPGDYSLVWKPPGAERALRLALRAEISLEAEMRDVSADMGLPQRLAESTGGAVLSLDRLQPSLDRVRSVLSSEPRTVEVRLWDSPYLFIGVIACLAIEWAMRKRFGLA